MLAPSQPSGKSGLSQTASLSDLLTTAKGIVTALNGTLSLQQKSAGYSSVSGITAATVVKGSAGTVVSINIAVAGSSVGAIYDAVSTSGITLGTTTLGLVADIPNTVGQITLHFPANNGIVIIPGSGQVVSVVYS